MPMIHGSPSDREAWRSCSPTQSPSHPLAFACPARDEPAQSRWDEEAPSNTTFNRCGFVNSEPLLYHSVGQVAASIFLSAELAFELKDSKDSEGGLQPSCASRRTCRTAVPLPINARVQSTKIKVGTVDDILDSRFKTVVRRQ